MATQPKTQSRTAKILSAASRHPELSALAVRAVDSGLSYSDFLKAALTQMAEPAPDSRGRRSPEWLEAASDLLVMRASNGRLPGHLAPEERARRERAAERIGAGLPGGGSILEIADIASRHLVDRVHRDVHFRAMSGSSDFPLLLGDTLAKIVEGFFIVGETSWRPIAKIATVRDFRPGKSIRLDMPDLGETPPGVPLPSSVPLEAGEAFAVREFGSTTSISFQALTNDASGILNAAGRAIADVALRTISTEVYAMIAANAVRLEDSVALFATSHPSGSNLKTGSLDAAGLGAAVAAVRDQKGMSLEPLNLKPTHLLVSSSQEAAAKELVGGWQEPLAVLTETRIPSGTYYVIARDWPALEIQTLFGDLAPTVTPTSSSDLRSKNFNAVLAFGVSMVDHRAWCKTTA